MTLRGNLPTIHLPWVVLGTIGSGIGAFGDGLLVGLAVGYVGLTAFVAPAAFLGVAPPVAIIGVGLLAAAVTILGAGLGWIVRAVLRWAVRRIGAAARRRGHPRLATVASAPLRFLAAFPLPSLGAFGILLWIVMAGRDVAPLGLLTPGAVGPYVYVVGVAGGLLGLARRAIRAPGGVRPGPVRRVVAAVAVTALVITTSGAIAIALSPGTLEGVAQHDTSYDGLSLTPAGLADPGAPGAYEVVRWTYGSGRDARRPAFGGDADVITPTVDASSVLPVLGNGADEIRRWFWGFGAEALPLDGLVWMPRGAGPYPLVLIVHGNHAMGDFSEDGYAYLAEHLASRGFIAVSIDEDFLNGSWVGEWKGNEQLVRAWLLLVHLDQWRSWNADPADPLHGTVDLDHVALIGHSRGGEAASIAAALDTRATAPRRSMRPWPTGLDVDAVVSIAPSDGQYSEALELVDTDFLTLQGGYDSDARAWSGIRQFARTTVAGDGFKAALWSYRANHGQFNSVWGRGDFGPYSGAVFNLAPLLDPADQEDIARTAIGAFLEVSLHDQDAYRGFFQRPMTGREWLPDDIVIVRSVDGDQRPLMDGEPDRFVDGLTERPADATTRPVQMPLRALQPDQSTRALEVAWEPGAGTAGWGLTGIASLGGIAQTTELRFALADARSADGTTPPLVGWLDATTTDGTTVSLPLERLGTPPPPLPVRLGKIDLLTAASGIDVALRSPAERVLQTYAVPMSMLEAVDARFRAVDLDTIAFRFERGSGGSIDIAELGLLDRPSR
ncbi:MAG TPA: hypothetical protein VFI69_08175 [Candidatus Limnocylindrales bacterium]|nr:hypothetical protein [Candidatus Limnocylindrales bacterium]